jgi:glycosyltransferase involved in cell wall biosynthesis
MVKIDLHVHSKFSDRPSEWFLQRLGTAESYSDPEYIYHKAIAVGMDYVALTDHNSIKGALILKEKYPDKVIVGVEATSYFPEDGCKIHVLIYGINQREFEDIEKLRNNIYLLRDYIKEKKLAYSIAHATFSVNNRLTSDHLEKLVLLFDVFEGINGARNKRSNLQWIGFLKELTREDISKLYEKHRIEPISPDPWMKGFTGGSDDHAGLFIGNTYTVAQAGNVEEILTSLKNKETFAEGRHNNYQGLTFAIYKIALDFIKTKSTAIQKSPLSMLSYYIFDDSKKSMVDKIKINFLKAKGKNEKFNKIKSILQELITNIKTIDTNKVDKKLDLIYEKIAVICDELLKSLFHSIETDLKDGNITDIVKNISSSIFGIFISIPFISTFNLLNKSRDLVDKIRLSTLGKKINNRSKKILWFTDTLNDLNGVSETLKTIGRLTTEKKENLKIITSLLANELDESIPSNIINLPAIYDFKLPHYEKIILKIPSILSSLKLINEYDPDEIIISTPGPVGLLGILATKLLNIKSIGVYHTDFASEVSKITEEDAAHQMTDTYINWFYSLVDEIRVPSYEYFTILENRGMDRTKMKLFKRGIDINVFKPVSPEENPLFQDYKIDKDSFNLLFVGRISKDKNLDFIIDIYNNLTLKYNNKVNIFFVGDGPYLEELKEKNKNIEGIVFTGKIKNSKLPEYYSMSDLLIFPSTTDTFGMAVLESQACGTPCLVSDIGGPKEIIKEGITGFVLPTTDIDPWIHKIEELMNLKIYYPEDFEQLKIKSVENALNNYNWDKVINELFSHEEETVEKINYNSIMSKLIRNKFDELIYTR